MLWGRGFGLYGANANTERNITFQGHLLNNLLKEDYLQWGPHVFTWVQRGPTFIYMQPHGTCQTERNGPGLTDETTWAWQMEPHGA